MPLHENYYQVRGVVDKSFVGYRRRCVAGGLSVDRIELWHDLLEAGLAADKSCPIHPGEKGWSACILAEVEECYLRLEG